MSSKRRILPRIPFRPYADVLNVPCNDRLADSVDPVNHRRADVRSAYNDECPLGTYEQTDLSTKIRKPRKRASEQDNFSGSQTLFAVIVRAILDTPHQMATLMEIYEYVERHFQRYTNSRKTWQNNVRHILSIHGCFVKGPTSSMHAHYWYIQSNLIDEFQRGDFSQRQRAKRRKRNVESRAPNNGKRKSVTRARAEDLENLKEICDSVEGKTSIPKLEPPMKPPPLKHEASWEDFYHMTFAQGPMNNDGHSDINKNHHFPPPIPPPTYNPPNVPFHPFHEFPHPLEPLLRSDLPHPLVEPTFRPPHYLDSPNHSAITPAANYPHWEDEFFRGVFSPGFSVGSSDTNPPKYSDHFYTELSVL